MFFTVWINLELLPNSVTVSHGLGVIYTFSTVRFRYLNKCKCVFQDPAAIVVRAESFF
jgi:hypothetical protein